MKTGIFRIIAALSFAAMVSGAFAQSAIIRGEESAGVYSNLKSTSGVLQTIINSGTVSFASGSADPCQNPGVAKLSAIVNISTATTTQLVALSGTTVIYVCSFNMTISQVVTTANTLKFVRGTGASCGTGTADLTGAFGTGGVTAAPPITVTSGSGHTLFKTNAGDALCATTTIGASAAFVGVVTYVQQ